MRIVELQHVRKAYGKTTAVEDVSLSIDSGEVVAVLGPNGAGKTTTLEMLLGLRHPNAGTVQLLGGRPSDPAIRSRIGVTPQQTGVPATLRTREIVEFVAKQYPRPAGIDSTIEAFGLTKYADRSAGGLSGGEMRRLGLALAFIGEPEFVVLDEPTTGLDVEARRAVWAYIRSYAQRGGTVLLTTHYMEEAEALASRIAIINAGRIVCDGTPQEIRRRVALRRVVYIGDPFDPKAFGIEATVEHNGTHVTVTSADTDAILRAIVRNDVAFRELIVSDGSLEDAVLSMTGES